MKLLARYNRISIIATVIVLLISTVCYYSIVKYALINQLDEDLKVEEQEVMDFVKSNHTLPSPSDYTDQQVLIDSLNSYAVTRSFSSITIFDEEEKKYIIVRQLVFPVTVSGKNYKVSILKSQEKTETLIQLMLFITLGIVIFLLLVLFFINRFLMNKLWRPFNSTLQELKQFNLISKKGLQLESTTINEFAELNHAVKIMADRVNVDYKTLKAFTENASHEMQTPLAVINSKLDVLIQDETINSNQLEHLQGIYNAMSKLSRLTKSLLLLTKIENNQFNETEEIRLDILLKEKIIQFEELAHVNNLTITTNLPGTFIKGNHHLIDILISNLFNNAIRYNKKNGTIIISIISNQLIISNTSFIGALDEQKIFQRFYRHSDTKEDGNGLGLSIIKQICDIYGYRPKYSYFNEVHEFSILF